MKILKSLLVLGVMNLAICNMALAAIEGGEVKNLFAEAAGRGVALMPHQGSVKGDHVNVRTQPTTNGSSVVTQADYVDLVILGRQDNEGEQYPWYRVLLTNSISGKNGEDDGYVGWIYGQFVDVDAEDEVFPKSFAKMAQAELGCTTEQTFILWGSPDQSQKQYIADFNWDLVTYTYNNGNMLKFRDSDKGHVVQLAEISQTGTGLGGLYVGEDWCTQNYVYSYLGKPGSIAYNETGDKNEIWEYKDTTGLNLIQVEFAADKTVHKISYHKYVD